jgi:uncharacterized protein
MSDGRRGFLRAQWRNLLLLNYEVEDALLAPLCPRGWRLDRWRGSAYVSVVGFQFLRTRVLGVRWPGFTNFPEINLRYYVVDERTGRRGVSFVREFVPSRIVASLARALYNEPYLPARIEDEVEVPEEGPGHVEYSLRREEGRMRIAARLEGELRSPPEGSLEHFFKEHDLGVGRDRAGRTLTYAVAHPRWRVRRVAESDIEIDWRRLYGDAWSGMSGKTPASVVYAEGSAIEVLRKNSVGD